MRREEVGFKYDRHCFQLERELKIRNYSKRTVQSYTQAFYQYRKFIRELNQDISLLDEDTVKDFLLGKKEQNCSPKTLNVYLSAIKFFYREIVKDPHQIQIKFAKRNKKNPVVLEHEEILKIIGTFQNLKHKLIVSLAYGSGLRVSEVVNLKIHDIDFNQGLIYVRQGKGRKDRVTVFPKSLTKDINRLVNSYNGNYVFVSQKGGKMSTRTLQKIFKMALKRAHIQKPATFHSLRHSFATHLLQAGVNLRYLQELLGHSDVRTTEIYTRVTNSGLKNIVSPL